MLHLAIAILCLGTIPGSFSNEDIHKFMTHDEVQQVFHTTHDSVPKYEIVKVHLSERSHKRDLSGRSRMHMRAFGNNINLWLHPKVSVLADEDTPVYYARYSPNKPEGVEYSRRDGLFRMVGRIFEDPRRLASLVIGREESGRTRINGYIGSNRMAVRSLPSRVAEEYRRRRRSVGDSDDLDSSYHVVFQDSGIFEGDYPALPLNVSALQRRISKSASTIPNTLFPEILVVVDNSMYKAYGRDIYGFLEYLLAFWNGVDLKYRSLESPRIRFHISGIVLSEDPHATPYISRNSLSATAFNSGKAMEDATTFYYGVKDSFPLDSYDISVTITTQDFGLDGDAAVLGKAWVGEACSRGNDNTFAVTIIRDDGAFQGVHVAAHELGHLLGSHHDSDKENCVYSNGFIMAFTPWYTTNSSDFSSCSIQALENLLQERKLDCLFNRPKTSRKSLPKLMPGRMKNLKDQCKALGYGEPCQDKSSPTDVCVNMYCMDDNGECRETGTAALDGTSCEGYNKFCLHMQCVSL